MLLRSLVLIPLPFLLGGCTILGLLGYDVSCAYYNGSRDGFRLGLYPSSLTLKVGQTAVISLETTWLDSELDRTVVSCNPDWYTYGDTDAVNFDEENLTVTGVKPGKYQLVARVKGSYMAQDEVAITVK